MRISDWSSDVCSSDLSALRRGIARVDREIGEGGLELNRVRQDGPEVGREHHGNFELLTEREPPQHDGVVDQHIHVEAIRLQRLPPRARTELSAQGSAAQDGLRSDKRCGGKECYK